MDEVVQSLVKGQERLEWAIQQQIITSAADREAMKNAVAARAMENPVLTGPATTSAAHPHISGVSLQKYQPGEDPDAFLLNFERAARACGWPVPKWPFFLAPLLVGEAQAAYQVANPTGDTSYADVKRIILDHLGLDQEAYRIRFRKERGAPGESPKTLFVRLKMAADKWLTPSICTREEIMDRIYLEQFLEALPYATQRWLRQHHHLTIEKAVDMATTFSRVQPRITQPWESEKHKTPMKTERKPLKPTEIPRPRTWRTEGLLPTGPQCFECGTWGHIARLCPRRKPQEEPMEVGYLPKAVMFSSEMGQAFRPSLKSPCWHQVEEAYSGDEEDLCSSPFKCSPGDEGEWPNYTRKDAGETEEVCLYTGGAAWKRSGTERSRDEEDNEWWDEDSPDWRTQRRIRTREPTEEAETSEEFQRMLDVPQDFRQDDNANPEQSPSDISPAEERRSVRLERDGEEDVHRVEEERADREEPRRDERLPAASGGPSEPGPEPGGHRHRNPPSHSPGGAWLHEVRERIAAWIGKRARR